ncbi:CHAP domain-containing protein [Veillonella sp. YH-vei2232]|uniref:CHAP domain-containing protein n=1 Tax=Veillonella absiana TaxID=3079305 RepID=A0ABU3Z8J9_9FIRM|nr:MULTISPECIES: CHAP domain-containing protein [unclassified Veillonella]MDV5063669.1 CHAP domain-containing protein [Veillonella sp. YH-vei2232]MDV5088243.1 CHAP domain-containing protein [Veillonella sp. YH-vei2233]
MSQKRQKPFRPVGKVSRLAFTEEERAVPTLEKSLKKAEKAADKLEKSQERIPKKKVIVPERVVNTSTGKSKVHLNFEEIDKPKPPTKLTHGIKSIPQKKLLSQVHKEIRKDEHDNVGLEAAHKTEESAEFVASSMQRAYRSHKLKPYLQLAKAEKNTVNAEINYLYNKNIKNNPQLSSNPLSRWQQKRMIKKEYLAARYGKGAKTSHQTAANTKKAVTTVADTTDKLMQFIVSHRKGFFMFLAIATVIIVLMSTISSCSLMLEGGLNSIIGTSYTSEDADIIATDNNYTAFENTLQQRIDNIESEYPDYDEYRYDLDTIGHNPHELAAYLTSLFQTYKPSEVQVELQRVFDLQYKLTLTPVVEVRYRTETRTDTWTDDDGNTHRDTYTVEVPYNYYILNVKLDNFSVTSIANKLLNIEQLEMYSIYLETRGNKPFIFGGGTNNSAPSTDLSGVKFENGTREGNQNIVNIAKDQVGNEGGQPYWSWYGFNSRVEWCACFVSWCLNQAGYSEPKFAACQSQGIPWFRNNGQWANGNYKDLAPGDVIFFDWEGDGSADHVGIVIGTDGQRVYTVEGNSGDSCRIRDYDINSNVIMGYGLMN